VASAPYCKGKPLQPKKKEGEDGGNRNRPCPPRGAPSRPTERKKQGHGVSWFTPGKKGKEERSGNPRKLVTGGKLEVTTRRTVAEGKSGMGGSQLKKARLLTEVLPRY